MVITKTIQLNSDPTADPHGICIVDITPQVEKQVAESGINDGTVAVFLAGSTAGLSTIEFEEGLLDDFKAMWERNAPRDITYQHDRRWGDGNGYAHVRASLLGAWLVIPFSHKSLTLGTWQQVVLVDFDNRPRSRKVILQIMGE